MSFTTRAIAIHCFDTVIFVTTSTFPVKNRSFNNLKSYGSFFMLKFVMTGKFTVKNLKSSKKLVAC